MSSETVLLSFPDLMSVQDLMSAFGIGRTKAYELIRSGALQSIKIGRAVRVLKISAVDFLLKNCYNLRQADGLRNDEGGNDESYRKPER